MDMDSTNGLMVEGTKDSGKTIKCMEKECSLSLMEGCMRVNTETIRRMDEGSTLGQMEDDLRVNSIKENSMDMESSSQRAAKGEKLNLRMVSE